MASSAPGGEEGQEENTGGEEGAGGSSMDAGISADLIDAPAGAVELGNELRRPGTRRGARPRARRNAGTLSAAPGTSPGGHRRGHARSERRHRGCGDTVVNSTALAPHESAIQDTRRWPPMSSRTSLRRSSPRAACWPWCSSRAPRYAPATWASSCAPPASCAARWAGATSWRRSAETPAAQRRAARHRARRRHAGHAVHADGSFDGRPRERAQRRASGCTRSSANTSATARSCRSSSAS